jgi:UDP-3-O-acyl-N-acetylglucosamine deacetylase
MNKLADEKDNFYYQQTISKSVTIEGINVLNGMESTMTFRPAEKDTGFTFLVNGEYLKANLNTAFSYRPPKSFFLAKCIAIGGRKNKAIKVEHVLSATYGIA